MVRKIERVERFFVLASGYTTHHHQNEVRAVFSGKNPVDEVENKPGIRTVFASGNYIESDWHHGSSPFKPAYFEKKQEKTHRFIIGCNIRIAKREKNVMLKFQEGTDVTGSIIGLFLDEWTAVGAACTYGLNRDHRRRDLQRCTCEVIEAVRKNPMFEVDGSDETGVGRYLSDDFLYKWRLENLPKRK